MMEVWKMKKYNLLKTLGIFFLVLFALSWIIPVGSYSGSEFSKGTTDPVGLFDFFRVPLITLSTFFQYGLVFLAIGGFYGVLEKTGVFSPFVERVAKKWKGKECKFLVIVMVVLGLIASLNGLTIPLFIFVPFLVAVILLMGFSKLTAIGSTVGAILVGMIGSTYGFNAAGYVYNFLKLDMNNQIATKIILFVMLLFLLVMSVTKQAKKELEVKRTKKKESVSETKKKGSKKEASKEEVVVIKEEVEIPFYDPKSKSKKSAVPMMIIVVLLVAFTLTAMFNWMYGFKINFFQELHTSLMDVKIGNYPILANILGNVSQIGYWGYYELSALLVIASLLIGWIYSLKMKDIVDSFFEGAKKMLGVAFYVMICNIIFAVLLNSESGNLYHTMNNFLLGLTKSFNVVTTAISALIGSFFYNDFYYLVGGLSGMFEAKFDANTLPVIGLAFQTMYGLAMLILPTSMILIAGLRYLEVSYKDWMKYIWKFVLSIFVIIMIVLVIASLFV